MEDIFITKINCHAAGIGKETWLFMDSDWQPFDGTGWVRRDIKFSASIYLNAKCASGICKRLARLF